MKMIRVSLEEDKKEKLQPLVDLMKLMEGWADEGKPIVSGFACNPDGITIKKFIIQRFQMGFIT